MRKGLSTGVHIVLIAMGLCICSTWALEVAADEIKITGSTTFAPLVKAVSEAFMKTHPSTKIAFTESNATESIAALIAGKTTIGCTARYVQPAESEQAKAKGSNLTCSAVALDSIIPIVHPSNNVKSMGLVQVNSIYKGQVKNWKEFFQGADSPIKVVTRETGSAMYEFWKDKVMKGDSTTPDAITLRSNQEIVGMVSEDPSAIGFTSYSSLNPQIKPLPLNGIDTSALPTENSPLSRKLFMCTDGIPTGQLKEWFDFMNGQAGKDILRKAGYVPF